MKRGDALQCCRCSGTYHYQCYSIPEDMFPNRLGAVGNSARWGDTRRPDFTCPRCQFKYIMGREPVRGCWKDNWLGLCEVRATIDEFMADSTSYAKGCLYTLRKISRWGDSYGVPAMVGHSRRDLERMPADHRQLRWYMVDQTRTSTWETAKKHRGTVFNFYERMGVAEHEIPTNTVRFRHFQNGHKQRKGESTRQDAVFSDAALKAITDLLSSNHARAKRDGLGEGRVRTAQVALVFHAYTQAGCRANELFEQEVGHLKSSLVVGADAASAEIMPHLKFRATLQTKENRFAATEVWCCYAAKRAPLKAGFWAETVLAELARVGRDGDNDLVFADPDGTRWKMGRVWSESILPLLEQLKREGLGGLGQTDLSSFNTNSFRRTWNTLAGQHPDPVSEDLRERQGRWRSRSRSRVLGRMVSLYFAPRPQELLLATYWL